MGGSFRGRRRPKKPVFELRSGFKVSKRIVQAVGEAAWAIGQGNNRLVTPERLMEVATDPNHPCHPIVFNRDIEAAAHEYYLSRARYLLRAINVVFVDQHGTEHRSRAWHNVYDIGEEERGYSPATFSFSDKDLRQQVLDSARRELEGWTNRHRQYKYLAKAVARAEVILKML